MKKFILLFIIIFSFCLSSYSNCSNQMDSLPLIKIENSELKSILDNILICDKKCDNYDKELIYQVMLLNNEDSTIQITIGSTGNYIVKNGYELGVFEYGDHTFVISGTKLDKTIFKKTKTIKPISFYLPNSESDEIVFFEDDSRSYWVYNYKKGKFSLVD